MKRDQFEREKEYGAAIAIAMSLLKQSLITEKEYREIKAALIEKYRPVIGSLKENAPSIPPKQVLLPKDRQ